MGNAGIDRDHEVKVRYKFRRVGEIPEPAAKIENIGSLFQYRRVLDAALGLQAYKRGVDFQ